MSRKARRSTRRAVRAARATDVPVRPEWPPEEEHGGAAKPISLYPLDFPTAIRGLLAVKWPLKKKRSKRREKPTT